MRRVIFVGLHNKPGMKPLDSKSKSGKLIDRIIVHLPAFQILKTNLFDVDYYPNEEERASTSFYWYDKVGPSEKDIIVLLGAAVHKDFPVNNMGRIIKIAHPASKRSHEQMNEYVQKTVTLILN